jgi:protein-S-isoprenylcysteine O-methyltransferase Ste14
MSRREIVSDFTARAVVGALFALLTINLIGDFVRTGHITGLLFIVSEGLVVVLTVVRRRASQVDRSPMAQVMTTVSVLGPPLLRVGTAPGLVPDLVSAVVLAIGTVFVIVGKLTLGRSFGLVPANRGVVARGPYNIVRHPIYSSYLITHIAFLLAHPTALNAAILIIADSALVMRALIEERVLGADAEYQAYCRRVGWHLVPGVF